MFNEGTYLTPPPLVVYNRGKVHTDTDHDDSTTGNVIYNYDGEVSNNIDILFDYHKLTSNLEGIALDNIVNVSHPGDMDEDGIIDQTKEANYKLYSAPLSADGDKSSSLYILDGADFTVNIPAGYTLRINGTGNSFSGTASFTDVTKNIELVFSKGDEPLPVDPGQGAPDKAEPAKSYSVPATGDMSNMPLWGALLIDFAAIAIATRKKKA